MAEGFWEILKSVAEAVRPKLKPTGPHTPLPGVAFPVPGVEGAAKAQAKKEAIDRALKTLGVETKAPEGKPEPGAKARPFKPATSEELSRVRGRYDTIQQTEMPMEGRIPGMNLSYLEGEERVKQIIAAINLEAAERITEQARGVRGHDVTEAAATRLLRSGEMTAEKLAALPPGTPLNAEQARAAKRLAGGAVALYDNLESQRLTNPESVSDETVKFVLGTAFQLSAASAGTVSEAARVVESQKMLLTPDPKELFLGIIENATKLKKMTAQQIVEMTHSFKGKDRESMFAKAGAGLFEYWINNLLYRPRTTAKKALSDLAMMGIGISERAMAGQIGRLTKHLPSEGVRAFGKTIIGGGSGVEPGEATAMLFGLQMASHDAWTLAGRAWETEGSAFQRAEAFTPRMKAITAERWGLTPDTPLGAGLDFLGHSMVRLPGRSLNAVTELAKAYWYQAGVWAAALRAGRREGLTGQRLADFIGKTVLDPPPGIQVEAFDLAKTQTFTKELGIAGGHLQKFLDTAPGARAIVPFFVVPTNFGKQAFQRTPILGLFSQQNLQDIAAGGVARDLAFARLGTGALIAIPLVAMAESGHLTGTGKAYDPKYRQFLKNSIQWKPCSVRVDDTYISMGSIEPWGLIACTVATYVETTQNATAEERTVAGQALAAMLGGMTAFGSSYANQPALVGVARLNQILQEPSRYLQVAGASSIGSLFPTAIDVVGKTINPQITEYTSLMDGVAERSSFLTGSYVKPARDAYGRYRLDETPFGQFHPFAIGNRPDDFGLLEADRMKWAPPRPPRSLGGPTTPLDPNAPESLKRGIPLSAEQQDRLEELIGSVPLPRYGGAPLGDAANGLQSSGEYQNATEPPTDGDPSFSGKARLLGQVWHEAFIEAEKQFYEEHPDVKASVDALRQQRQDALRPSGSSSSFELNIGAR